MKTDAVIRVSGETGELLAPEQDGIVRFQQASMLKLTPDEEKILSAPVNPDLVSIRPDGLVYIDQAEYRNVLNTAFGRGQWVLIPVKDYVDDNKIYWLGHLYVRGCFVGAAMGEHKHEENNKMTSRATTWESAKSDCITRLCKDLGIFRELWNKRFVSEWQKTHAVKVWRSKKMSKYGKLGDWAWRLKTDDPFYDEGKGNGQEPDGNAPQAPTSATKPNPAPVRKRNTAGKEPLPNLTPEQRARSEKEFRLREFVCACCDVQNPSKPTPEEAKNLSEKFKEMTGKEKMADLSDAELDEQLNKSEVKMFESIGGTGEKY